MLVAVDAVQGLTQPPGEQHLAERGALSEIGYLRVAFQVVPAEGLELLDKGQFDLGVFGRSCLHSLSPCRN